MRFPIVAVLFIIAVFGFFIGYAISSLLLDEVGSALAPLAEELNSAELNEELNLIPFAFGIICSISLILICVIFFLQSTADEPEYYWRR